LSLSFFLNDPPSTPIYTLSLHDALPIFDHRVQRFLQLKDFATDVDGDLARKIAIGDGCRHLGDVAHLPGQIAGHRVHTVGQVFRSEEHTSELQSRENLVCRLLLEKKKKT